MALNFSQGSNDLRCDQFWNELPAVFEWLYGRVERVERPIIPEMGAGIDESRRPPVMAQTWSSSVPLEIIQFAASNRLCVNLSYKGQVVQPLSFDRFVRSGQALGSKRLTPDGGSTSDT